MDSKNLIIVFIAVLSIFIVGWILLLDEESNNYQKELNIAKVKLENVSSSVVIERSFMSSLPQRREAKDVESVTTVKKDGFVISIRNALPKSEDRPITVKFHTANQILSLSLPQFYANTKLAEVTLKTPYGGKVILRGKDSSFLFNRDSIVDIYISPKSNKIESIHIDKMVDTKATENSSSFESNLPHFNY